MKYKKFGSGELQYKIPLKKSRKTGKLYTQKTSFQTKTQAKERVNALRTKGHKAWVEGRTVYIR